MKYNTAVLHGNFGIDKGSGATLTPIYQSSAFAHETAEEIEKVFHNQAPGFAYTRINNPTIGAFENRITYLEGGIASVATSSGMAALTATFLNILRSGDEIISKQSIYGGTLNLFKDLEHFGIKIHTIPEITKEELDKTVNENTKAVFAETIGNPKLDVLNIRAAADLIHGYDIPFILDNTTATTYIVKGIEHGADIIINSSSKYINGNSNSISGIITDSGNYKWTAQKYPSMKDYVKFGKFAFTAKLRNDTFQNIGCCLSPQNAYYNSLGLETLSLRMERQCANALKLAESLENEDGILSVNYPMLKSSPYYETAKTVLNGIGGAILTLRLYSKKRAYEFINHLKYATNISNIGDTKTLVVHCASTIFCHSDKAEQERAGVYDDLIRVSVGIEDIEDLIGDFKQALDYVNKILPYKE